MKLFIMLSNVLNISVRIDVSVLRDGCLGFCWLVIVCGGGGGVGVVFLVFGFGVFFGLDG